MTDEYVTPQTIFAERLRRKLTQTQAGNIAGQSRATWSRYETGAKPMPAWEWADWLHCADKYVPPTIPLRASTNPFTRDIAPLPGDTLPDRLNRLEARWLRRALKECNGNVSAAARYLGLTFRQMRYALDKHVKLTPASELDPLQ